LHRLETISLSWSTETPVFTANSLQGNSQELTQGVQC
jgi:hypothetical protein